MSEESKPGSEQTLPGDGFEEAKPIIDAKNLATQIVYANEEIAEGHRKRKEFQEKLVEHMKKYNIKEVIVEGFKVILKHQLEKWSIAVKKEEGTID